MVERQPGTGKESWAAVRCVGINQIRQVWKRNLVEPAWANVLIIDTGLGRRLPWGTPIECSWHGELLLDSSIGLAGYAM